VLKRSRRMRLSRRHVRGSAAAWSTLGSLRGTSRALLRIRRDAVNVAGGREIRRGAAGGQRVTAGGTWAEAS
jgi:hypothetical protein